MNFNIFISILTYDLEEILPEKGKSLRSGLIKKSRALTELFPPCSNLPKGRQFDMNANEVVQMGKTKQPKRFTGVTLYRDIVFMVPRCPLREQLRIEGRIKEISIRGCGILLLLCFEIVDFSRLKEAIIFSQLPITSQMAVLPSLLLDLAVSTCWN